MKKLIVLALAAVAVLVSCNNSQSNKQKGQVISIGAEDFTTKIMDYNAEDGKYMGTLPAVVDFYADWCGPCKMMSPIMDQLAKEYEGKVLFYKVNIDENPELSITFGIQSIPMFLFFPTEGEPSSMLGAMSKEEFKGLIEEALLK